jgi:hypothetical protein
MNKYRHYQKTRPVMLSFVYELRAYMYFVLKTDGNSERFGDLIFKNTTDCCFCHYNLFYTLQLANVGRASILTHKEERFAIITVLADERWGDGTMC